MEVGKQIGGYVLACHRKYNACRKVLLFWGQEIEPIVLSIIFEFVIQLSTGDSKGKKSAQPIYPISGAMKTFANLANVKVLRKERKSNPFRPRGAHGVWSPISQRGMEVVKGKLGSLAAHSQRKKREERWRGERAPN